MVNSVTGWPRSCLLYTSDYALGIAAALFCMAGSYFGAGLVVNNGQKIVRPVVMGVLALLFVKILAG